MAAQNLSNESGVNTALTAIDHDFCQLGYLGGGGFAKVFLARKRSDRKVALKVFTWTDEEDDPNRISSSEEEQMSESDMKLSSFERELDAVLRLDVDNDDEKTGEVRKLSNQSIIFFEDWFQGPNFACIVMKHADSGTLAQEISKKCSNPDNDFEPYTERRIAWYLSQLCDALQFAHKRGVAHMDVKSANVLIDKARNGHKLILTDWGSACTLELPISPPAGFRLTMVNTDSTIDSITELYAAPELQSAYNRGDFHGLAPIPIDSFALGCILFELLCCKKMYDLTEHDNETLGEFIGKHNTVTHALASPCLRIPFEDGVQSTNEGDVRYSAALRDILGSLIDPDPTSRFSPFRLFEPLRSSSVSPLLEECVSAAQLPIPGVPVTIDNVQLGMFVQRGPDWSDFENDGGVGSIGVITRLDPDGSYAEATFPSLTTPQNVVPTIYRIGASNKYELQVGPTLVELTTGINEKRTVPVGILECNEHDSVYPGLILSDGNAMVLAVQKHMNRIFVAPTGSFSVAPQAFPVHSTLFRLPVCENKTNKIVHCENSQSCTQTPSTRQAGTMSSADRTRLVDVADPTERDRVLAQFHSANGGFDIQEYEVCRIQRLQSAELLASYASCRETVIFENWGISNERRLFHGTVLRNPTEILSDDSVCLGSFFTMERQNAEEQPAISFHVNANQCDKWSHKVPESKEGLRIIVLCRVELGRVSEQCLGVPASMDGQMLHSVKKHGIGPVIQYDITNGFQAYPENVITYKKVCNPPSRRILQALRPTERPSNCSQSSRSFRSRRILYARRPTERPSNCRQSGRRRERRARPRPQQSFSPQSAPVGSPNTVCHPGSNVSQSLAATTQAFENLLSIASPANDSISTALPSDATSPSKIKKCVICMERPVSHVLVPCGHPCLCEVCSTAQGLARLNSKCPECRNKFREAIRLYGKVLEH